MKKTMKTMLAFVAGALVLSACNNEDAIINENPSTGSGQAGAKLVTLTAYQEGEGASRAAIDATDNTLIDWTANDQINYFCGATGQSMTLKTGAGTTEGTFEGIVTTGAADYVLYPYQSTATNNAGVITAEVPMTQYAVANSFDPKAALMVGVVNGSTVEFKNVMSYVKVTIPEDMANCKQVSLKAKQGAWTTVAGKVNITASTGEWAETTAKEGQAFVRLVPQDGDDYLTAGASYYIAILPQTMSTGFELIFNDNDVIRVKQSKTESVAFARNTTKKLGAITSFTYNVTTKDLAAPDGATYTTLKMADRNIGVGGTGTTLPTGTDTYGDYFAWGALRPAYTQRPEPKQDITELYWSVGFKYINTPFYTGNGSTHSWSKYNSTDNKTVLDATDDIAAMLWGGNWRMPTKDEWEKNTSNYSVQGLARAGEYGGSGGTVASPLAGSHGFYWSSTSNGNSAYIFHTYSNTFKVGSNGRYYGYSVRPVLAQ